MMMVEVMMMIVLFHDAQEDGDAGEKLLSQPGRKGIDDDCGGGGGGGGEGLGRL